MKYLLIGFLKAWRLVVSPLYGNVCRYYPSCSAYALRAVQVHGGLRGSWYAVRRLLRCHPWAPGGYDPVPGTPEFDEEMCERRLAAVTIEGSAEAAGPDHQVDVGPPAGQASVISEWPGPDEPRRDELPDGQRTQGRVATVAQLRGVK